MTDKHLGHLAPGEGKSLRVGVFDFTFKAGRDSASGYTFAEVTVPPGATNGPHSHPCEETMYVLSGELDFVDASGQHRRVSTEAAIHVPANAVHGYTNATATPARLLVVAPVAQEDVFAALAAANGDPAKVADAMARHGVVPAKRGA